MDCDDISVFYAEIMPNHSVHACTSVIKIIISQHNQDCVPSFFALDKDRVTPEKLEGLHRVIGKGDDGVVIVYGVGHPKEPTESVLISRADP